MTTCHIYTSSNIGADFFVCKAENSITARLKVGILTLVALARFLCAVPINTIALDDKCGIGKGKVTKKLTAYLELKDVIQAGVIKRIHHGLLNASRAVNFLRRSGGNGSVLYKAVNVFFAPLIQSLSCAISAFLVSLRPIKLGSLGAGSCRDAVFFHATTYYPNGRPHTVSNLLFSKLLVYVKLYQLVFGYIAPALRPRRTFLRAIQIFTTGAPMTRKLKGGATLGASYGFNGAFSHGSIIPQNADACRAVVAL